MSRSKLLVLTTTFPRWPDDHEPAFVYELSKRLVDHFDVTVIAPHAPGAAQRETLDGMDIVRFRYAPERFETLAYAGGIGSNLRRAKWKYLLLQGFLLSFFFTTLAVSRKQQIDVIHAHWMIPGGVIGAAVKILFPRLRVVATSHGADVLQLRGRLFQRIRRWVADEVDAVTVVGSALADRARDEQWLSDKVSVAPMGVDLQHVFMPVRRPHDHPTLVFAGRLVEKKGVQHLIEGMPLIREKVPNVRLLIAGHGPMQDKLERRVHELGLEDATTFVGRYQADRLPQIFGDADVAVLPFVEASDGDAEGLGLTTVEAIGCGLPVIVGDVPAIHDVVTHRENGLVVRPAVAGELVDAVLELLNDREQAARLSEHGRSEMVTTFDWSPVAERYRRLLLPVSD